MELVECENVVVVGGRRVWILEETAEVGAGAR